MYFRSWTCGVCFRRRLGISSEWYRRRRRHEFRRERNIHGRGTRVHRRARIQFIATFAEGAPPDNSAPYTSGFISVEYNNGSRFVVIVPKPIKHAKIPPCLTMLVGVIDCSPFWAPRIHRSFYASIPETNLWKIACHARVHLDPASITIAWQPLQIKLKSELNIRIIPRI